MIRKGCISCGSVKQLKYSHCQKVTLPIYKKIAKYVLPYFDCFIPKSMARLKRVSSSKPGTKKNEIDYPRGHILVCADCGYGYSQHPPRESILSAYYANEYFNNRERSKTLLKNNPEDYKHDLRALSQMHFISPYLSELSPLNILEIGAGKAGPAQHLMAHYPASKVSVCEPSSQMGEYYAKHNIQRIAEYFPFESVIKYDYIHTSHWLEHVLNLEPAIISLQSLLSKNGLLFIEVPNCTPDYWSLIKEHGTHIHYFTMSALINIFGKFHFKCLKVGEFGNTLQEVLAGENIYYGRRLKGCSIRALFQRGQTNPGRVRGVKE